MPVPDNYDSKTKIAVFYSLSNAFDLISGSEFREDILYPNILKLKWITPVYQWANPY